MMNGTATLIAINGTPARNMMLKPVMQESAGPNNEITPSNGLALTQSFIIRLKTPKQDPKNIVKLKYGTNVKLCLFCSVAIDSNVQ